MSGRWWKAVSVSSLVAALALVVFSGVFVQAPRPQINVRWHDSVDARARTALEQRFTLIPVEQIAPNAWRYELVESSPEVIAALVAEPAVADTHHLDRGTFEILPDAPRGERHPAPWAARWPAVAFALVDAGPVLLIVLGAAAWLFARDPALPATLPARAREWLTRGIPALSPRAFAIFRFVFGLALALYIYTHLFSREPYPRELWRSDVRIATVAPVRWLIEHPSVVFAAQAAAAASALLLAVGVLPRVMFAVTAIGIVQWLLALSVHEDAHKFGVLIIPMLALLAARWDAAPPVWALRSRESTPSRLAGYAPWMLTVALGAAWAAAAWSKLRDGPGWVLNGAVRYHFVTDYPNAHVDWGLAIAAMPVVAILLSGAAVAIEAFAIAAALFDAPLVRLAIGLAGAGLLAGFYLFQGLVWPAWWMLLLGFLPWSWLNDTRTHEVRAGGQRVPALQLSLAVVLLAQQLIVSAAFVEFPPIVSRYDMYSTSHESPEAFERDNPAGVRRRLLAVDSHGVKTDVSSCAAHVNQLADLSKVDPATPPPPANALDACTAAGGVPERLLVVENRCGFDWKAGHFYCSDQDTVIAAWPVRR